MSADRKQCAHWYSGPKEQCFRWAKPKNQYCALHDQKANHRKFLAARRRRALEKETRKQMAVLKAWAKS